MKKIMLAAMLMLGICSVSVAQAPTQDSTKHKRSMHHKRNLHKQLNLTQEQKDKLHAYNKDMKAKRDAVKNNQSLSETDKKTQLKALRENSRKHFASVLTDEQKQKMKEAREKRKNHSPRKSTALPNTGNS